MDLGKELTQEQKNLVTSLKYDSNKFKYFTIEQLEKDLEIFGVEMDLLIDFQDNIIINPEGIEIKGKKYYSLENNKYKVNKNTDKNVGEVDFDYEVVKYGTNSYKVRVIPINIGDISKGIVQYKKSTTEDWKLADDKEFIIKQLTKYDIKYTDANNNVVSKKISLRLDENGDIIASEVDV